MDGLRIEFIPAAAAPPELDHQIDTLDHLAFTGNADEPDSDFDSIEWAPTHAYTALGWLNTTLVTQIFLHHRAIMVGGEKIWVAGVGGVATHPQWQRKGLASQLLRASEAFMQTEMCVPFGLLVCADETRPFYEKVGWRYAADHLVFTQNGQHRTLQSCVMVNRLPANAPGDLEEAATTASERRSWAGVQPAPDFPADATWLNVARPLRLADLRGRAVILDFWTLGCINCQHIIPDLKRLEGEFADSLVIIGVHSGKYDDERDPVSVREAIKRYGLEHPVVNDPDFRVWQAYGVHAWPTLVLIDPAGNVVGNHAGEGIFDLFQPILVDLLAEFSAQGLVRPVPLPAGPAATGPATVL